jgi:hypothetical protein
VSKRLCLPLLTAAAMIGSATVQSAPAARASAPPRVLRVGSYRGIGGQFTSIQAAVNAAHPGDWILVGPGDYHERGSNDPELPAGVLIETPNIHLRGMNRNTVVIDGTKRIAPKPCDAAYRSQQYGSKVKGHWAGMNGVVVSKVSGVSIENLTVCNYLLTKHGTGGNEIWWNGGDGSGEIGMHGYSGAFLTASATYSHGADKPRGDYGIFVSNADGPGVIFHSYASNMGDSGFYVGACPDCNIVLNDIHSQHNADGYSGTNSGGHLIIENSEFDHNKTGLSTDSENNDDQPSPQDGVCPANGKGPTGTSSCWEFRNNFVHDNNDPNVPGVGSGLAGAAPIGTGLILAGGRDDTIDHNRFENNGSWGFLLVDMPYMGTPPPNGHCNGGIDTGNGVCYFQAYGSEIASNTFKHNGFFGNATNGDIGMATQQHDPGNCYHDNSDPDGLTSDPPNIQDPPYNPCGDPNGGDLGPLVAQVLCATQLVAECPGSPATSYPRPTKVTTTPIPKEPTMPDPCKGVPANPWCPNGGSASSVGGVAVAAYRDDVVQVQPHHA